MITLNSALRHLISRKSTILAMQIKKLIQFSRTIMTNRDLQSQNRSRNAQNLRNVQIHALQLASISSR